MKDSTTSYDGVVSCNIELCPWLYFGIGTKASGCIPAMAGSTSATLSPVSGYILALAQVASGCIPALRLVKLCCPWLHLSIETVNGMDFRITPGVRDSYR